MATGSAPATILPPAPPAPSDSREREQLIRRQLGRTGLQVRLVDLASTLAVWIIGVLLLFLLAAIVDHFVGLGIVGRCLGLAVLVGGSLSYLVRYVGPLIVRTINPAYAARTIEEATPTLKNSLINFLLLKQDRTNLKEIVYQAVERQAAADIATVPVEATVDRSRLIHAGYVLCAVMAVFAAYKILSPKDPFQSVARVLAPWADIARPSRVQISDVQPGSTQVYHGQSVAIAATVRGARDGDSVKLLFSTADGQASDQVVEMKLAAGDRYECTLPPTDGSAPATATGLQQDVIYRIVAGDAESFPYRLTVISSPTIIVERLDYQYPAYSNKAAESVPQQGDIKALEGTRVSVHAIANQPIKSAWIEFDATGDGVGEVMPLSVEGDKARGALTLLLKPGGQTPWHSTYQVRFYNEQGQRSRQPVVHKIEVIRDLPPEVQILKPERLRVEVPEDGEEPIEVRALDPDYGLASLRLEGAAAGKPPIVIELFEKDAGQPPQATVSYAFRPREHKLSAGNELRFSAVAEDNRTNPQTGQPQGNVARTKEYTLVVLPPQKNNSTQGGQNQQPQDGQQPGAQKQPGPQKPDKQPRPNEQQPNEQPPNQNPQNGQQNKEQTQRPNEKSQQEKSRQEKNQQPMNEGAEGQQQQQSGKQSGEPKNEKQQGGNEGSDSKQQGAQQQKGQGKEGQQKNEPQAGQQQGGQSGDGQQGDQQASDQQGRGQQQGQSGGKAGSSQQGDPSGGGQSGGQQSQARAGGRGHDQGKTDQGKADDGRAIEEVWKDLQRDQASQPGGNQNQQGGQSQRGGKQQGERGASPPGQEQSEPMPGDAAQGPQPRDSQEKSSPGQQSGNEQGGQSQTSGASSAQGQNTPNPGTPEGNDQQPGQKGNQQRAEGKAAKSDRLDDQKQGQNPSEQKSSGAKGGESHGASKTDKGEKSPSSNGEQRDPGAGKTGDEGAGQASEDKSGSGDGAYKNLDHKKELKPDSNKQEKNEPSPANSSHRQSDSKGGSSGENSGGGKQGAGQGAGQQGNDSAGSQSAADQGAGKANETGSGETGSKAGDQQKADGKTGKSGKEAGKGSGSRSGDQGTERGAKSDEPSPGEASKSPRKSDSRERSQGGAAGSEPVGGADDERQRFQNKVESSVEQEADAANLEYARKATEMVLKRLKEEEHNPDPELLDKLGWTREDLAEFLRRWDALQKSAGDSPAGKRELDESLKSLGLRDPASRKRAGGKTSDNQRDLRDAGNRSAPPPRYRELFDAFRKGAARSSP